LHPNKSTKIANKFVTFHTKRLNRSENIPKSFRGATFSLKHQMSQLIHSLYYPNKAIKVFVGDILKNRMDV